MTTVISEDEARAAVAVLVELLDAEDQRGVLVRERAASSLVRLYLQSRQREQQNGTAQGGAADDAAGRPGAATDESLAYTPERIADEFSAWKAQRGAG